jgi:hypothetical protein
LMTKFKAGFLFLSILALVYYGAKYFRHLSVADELRELKTEHFNISYYGIYETDASRVAQHLEENYDRIRDDLKDRDHDKINVFIHPTQNDFNKITGLVGSSANGTSKGPREFHFIWTNWFNSLFPDNPVQTAIHEFTHCVQLNILIKEAQSSLGNNDSPAFDRAFETKFANQYPQWFWEALSIYQADEVNWLSVKFAMRHEWSLDELNKSSQIYNVGYTIIEYIVATWGKEKLPLLISSYVDLPAVLNVTEEEFEQGWRNFTNTEY